MSGLVYLLEFVFYTYVYALPHIEIAAKNLFYQFDILLLSEEKQKFYVIETETALLLKYTGDMLSINFESTL